MTLQNPHAESAVLAGLRLAEWAPGLPEEDTQVLVDCSSGKPIQWVLGKGWVELPE